MKWLKNVENDTIINADLVVEIACFNPSEYLNMYHIKARSKDFGSYTICVAPSEEEILQKLDELKEFLNRD